METEKKNVFHKVLSFFGLIKNGFIVGSSMLVPGVSGGTMALILGIYDKLISSINNIFKDFKVSFYFLLQFCIGAVLGFVVFGKSIGWLVDNFEIPVKYFFIGAVLGGLPLLFKKSTVMKNSTKDIFIAIISFILGAGIVFSLSLLPTTSSLSVDFSLTGVLIMLATGIIVAIALVLPGISTSHMLIIMGVYYPIINNTRENLSLIAMLGISTVIGILLITRFLEFFLVKFPKATYFCIIGFVLGSIKQLLLNDTNADEIYYAIPVGFEWVIAIITVVLGFIVTFLMSKKERES